MAKEKVKLNSGEEAEIECKHIMGRKAFQLGPKILVIKGISQGKDGEMSAKCDMNSAVDICWDVIVAPCPQKDDVTSEDMQRIFEKYAKKDIDFVIKKNLENFGK